MNFLEQAIEDIRAEISTPEDVPSLVSWFLAYPVCRVLFVDDGGSELRMFSGYRDGKLKFETPDGGVSVELGIGAPEKPADGLKFYSWGFSVPVPILGGERVYVRYGDGETPAETTPAPASPPAVQETEGLV